jgi:hypothetical protein
LAEAFLVGFAPILVAVLVLFLLKEEKTAATEKVDQSPLKALFQPQNRQKLFTGQL